MIRFLTLIIFLITLYPHDQLSAKPVTVRDITGRTVTLEKPAERIIIGEGRYLAWLGIFERENPVKRVVGMLNDLYHSPFRTALEQKFPEFKNIQHYGQQSADSVSAEKMLSLKPDLAIFGLHDHGPGARNRELIELLEKAGVKIVFIDFRMNPLKNTLPSLRMLAKVLGREAEGQAYIDYYQSKLDLISARLKTYKGKRPTAFLQAHPGRFQCCVGMADGMLGPYLEFVGAENISSKIAPGPTAVHTMEFLLSRNPDIWIGTASGTLAEYRNGKSTIFLGPEVTEKQAIGSLKRATGSEAMQNLKAVKSGRAHGIWHSFYNSPFNIVAVAAFARWVHPNLFNDLSPESVMDEIYDKFLPLKINGIYTISLNVAD